MTTDPSPPALDDASLAAFVDVARAVQGLTIEPAWRDAVVANFKATANAAALVLGFPLEDELDVGPVFAPPISFVGLPVAAAPVPVDDGLPLGVQIIAAPWREDLVLRVAWELERVGVARAPVAGV